MFLSNMRGIRDLAISPKRRKARRICGKGLDEFDMEQRVEKVTLERNKSVE
jgi:hypothetical protein